MLKRPARNFIFKLDEALATDLHAMSVMHGRCAKQQILFLIQDAVDKFYRDNPRKVISND